MNEELELFDPGPPPERVPTFDEWYQGYPRKQGKAEARKRWNKMSNPERASALMALPAWQAYASVEGTQFVPYASTWLNQSRWEDQAPTPTRRQGPGMTAVREGMARARANRSAIAGSRTPPNALLSPRRSTNECDDGRNPDD